MSTINLTEKEFEATVTQDGIVFVDLWAAWCGPCRMFGPIFEAASEEHTDVVFAKVDTQAEPGISQALDVQGIPTILAFRDGICVYNEAGALDKPGLEELIQAVKGLDMDEIRAKIAASEEGN